MSDRMAMAALYRQQAATFVKMAELLEGVNKEVPKRAPVKRRTQLSIDKLPDEWATYCAKRRPDLNPQDVFENFSDFYVGHGRAMLDWGRTWQRWVRNESASRATGGSGGVPKDAAELQAFVTANGLPQARPGESLYDWRSRVTVAYSDGRK
jgi:hypothetical protein